MQQHRHHRNHVAFYLNGSSLAIDGWLLVTCYARIAMRAHLQKSVGTST